MNRAIDDLIESARLLGGTQAKRGFGVYTQDDAIMERAFWEGVEARAKAIRDEVVALKAERDRLLAVLRIVRGKHGCGALTLPKADLERIDATIAKAEGRKE